MLRKLFKTGVTAAAGWVGNAIGGETGRNIATKAVGSLFSKDGGGGGDFELQTQNPNAYQQNFGGRLGFDRDGGSGGNFQLADTSVSPQSYGGRVGFERSDSAGNVNKIKTADGKQLSEEWEYRLNKWYKNKDTRYT